MNLAANEIVKIFRFEDEELSNLHLAFDGDVAGMRDVKSGWDGFEIGERFNFEDEEVRVYQVRLSLKDQDSVKEHAYYVGPNGLNVYKLKSID